MNQWDGVMTQQEYLNTVNMPAHPAVHVLEKYPNTPPVERTMAYAIMELHQRLKALLSRTTCNRPISFVICMKAPKQSNC